MKNKKSLLRQICVILAGNFLVAMAVSFFVLPNDLLTGGVACLAIDLAPFVPIGRVTLIYIISISLFILGWIVLGRKFAASTFLSSMCYPVFISLFELLDLEPFSEVDPVVASVFAGLILGAGIGMVFNVGGSSGGMDIPALILHKYTHIPINNAVMIVDGLTILLGVYSYGLNAMFTGLISVFASNFAINWISTAGSMAAKSVMIISGKWPEIQQYLLHEAKRGVTILEGTGGYSQERKPVLLCAVSSRQYPKLAEHIMNIDPKAFMIVSDVKEIRGLGFSYPYEGEPEN